MISFSIPSITKKEIDEVVKVLKSRWITTGYKNKLFAEEINKYIGSKYCVPMNSATSALHVALACAGVKEGDEVITTPMTFVATANAILYLNAKPVLVDIKESDFIIDEDKIEEKITKKTKAIIAVHYAGFSANLDKLKKICKKYKLELIEDAAHSFASKYKNEFVGKDSKYCCLSFYATKNITTTEGGALLTNDKKVYDLARTLALHGITHDAWKRYTKEGSWKYDVTHLGFKYNLPDINAVLGLVQLKRIKQLYQHREKLFSFYKKELSKIKQITLLAGNEYTKAFRHLFVILVNSNKPNRDEFIELLKKKDIVCSVHFIPLYKFTLYKKLFNLQSSDFPVTESVFNRCVSLPFGSDLSLKDAKIVVKEIKKIFDS